MDGAPSMFRQTVHYTQNMQHSQIVDMVLPTTTATLSRIFTVKCHFPYKTGVGVKGLILITLTAFNIYAVQLQKTKLLPMDENRIPTTNRVSVD